MPQRNRSSSLVASIASLRWDAEAHRSACGPQARFTSFPLNSVAFAAGLGPRFKPRQHSPAVQRELTNGGRHASAKFGQSAAVRSPADSASRRSSEHVDHEVTSVIASVCLTLREEQRRGEGVQPCEYSHDIDARHREASHVRRRVEL
jgi:hypothetical protein